MNTEALVIAAGQNVKRLFEFGGRSPEKIAQAAALRPPERLPLRPIRSHRTGPCQGVSQQADAFSAVRE